MVRGGDADIMVQGEDADVMVRGGKGRGGSGEVQGGGLRVIAVGPLPWCHGVWGEGG